MGLVQDYHNPKFILKTRLFFQRFFYFIYCRGNIYFLKKLNFPQKKKILIFYLYFYFYLLSLLDIFQYLNNTKLGGGAILKINQILFRIKIYFYFNFINWFALIIDYIRISKKFVCFTLLIFCFQFIYFKNISEPLIIILLFTLMDLRSSNIKLLKEIRLFLFTMLFCNLFYW